MTADERIALIRVKVERAKQHFSDLGFEIERFRQATWLEGGPYEVATKHDPNTGELIYYVSRTRDVSNQIPVIAGDVLQNTRTALDHLVHHLFDANNPGVQPSRALAFPISDTATKYKTESVGKIKGLRQDAIDFINRLEPYKGGNANELLWRLHQLNIIDKHRLLIAVTASYQGRSVTEGDWANLRNMLGGTHPALARIKFIAPPRPDWNIPLKAGYEFHRVPPNSEVDQDMKLTVDITFAEPQVLEGETIIEALQQMIDWVDAIIWDCRRFLS